MTDSYTKTPSGPRIQLTFDDVVDCDIRLGWNSRTETWGVRTVSLDWAEPIDADNITATMAAQGEVVRLSLEHFCRDLPAPTQPQDQQEPRRHPPGESNHPATPPNV